MASHPSRGLWHFALRFYLNLAQVVLAFMVLVYHGDEPCDTPVKTFVLVQGAVSTLHMALVGTVEASVVGGEHERYLDALNALQSHWIHGFTNCIQFLELVWVIVGTVWLADAVVCSDSVLLLGRLSVGVTWLVLLISCCFMPCILSAMAGEEIADHVARRLNFSIPGIRGGFWIRSKPIRAPERGHRREGSKEQFLA